jgi:hypothetical protein
MMRQPFLIQFAEPVLEVPRPSIEYDLRARTNRFLGTAEPLAVADLVRSGTYLTETREQRDLAEHASIGWEGTVVTMTSESKDHVEDDRILSEIDHDPLLSIVGTKKTGSVEQQDPADGDRNGDLARPARATADRLLEMLGTKKTDSREQSDPADVGDPASDATRRVGDGAPDRLLAMLGTEKSGTREGADVREGDTMVDNNSEAERSGPNRTLPALGTEACRAPQPHRGPAD